MAESMSSSETFLCTAASCAFPDDGAARTFLRAACGCEYTAKAFLGAAAGWFSLPPAKGEAFQPRITGRRSAESYVPMLPHALRVGQVQLTTVKVRAGTARIELFLSFSSGERPTRLP